MITVLTPSYNRGSLLANLYQSLLRQDYNNFEWIIVDDGSKDNTNSIVNDFIQDRKISISYFKQTNGGKHRALNKGVLEAKGELILIVDSDDTLPDNSLYIINHYYLEVKDDSSFAGVCGRMAHHDGTVIGYTNISKNIDISSIEMRYRCGFRGDMCEVFKTEVLRDYPFPEIENEKFCPEALVWNRIARKYKLRFFDQIVYFRDYLDGGLTSKIVSIRMNSPIASTICYGEMLDLHIPIKDKIKAAINYWRFYFCIENKSKIRKRINLLWVGLLPIGWAFHIKDRIRIKKK